MCKIRTLTGSLVANYFVVPFFREFSDSVLRCLPPFDYVPPLDEIARRLDYRGKIVCSIDPPGCKDIDDALSCERLENGNYLVSETIDEGAI